jgi:hypothetical protein
MCPPAMCVACICVSQYIHIHSSDGDASTDSRLSNTRDRAAHREPRPLADATRHDHWERHPGPPEGGHSAERPEHTSGRSGSCCAAGSVLVSVFGFVPVFVSEWSATLPAPITPQSQACRVYVCVPWVVRVYPKTSNNTFRWCSSRY